MNAKYECSPGPSDYNTINYKSIDNLSQGGLASEEKKKMNKTLFKVSRTQFKKIFFKEYSREFMNVDGPGPGRYSIEPYSDCFIPKKGKGIGFPM